MNRILNVLRDTPYKGKSVVTTELYRDIKWFVAFAESSNGLVLIKDRSSTKWVIECDSSLRGAGAHSNETYYSEAYSDSFLKNNYNICQLEAINLVKALQVLSPIDPSNFTIIINTDNMASQLVLSSGAGKDKILCACSREIWRLAAIMNCDIEIKHKPGKDLILADALSRQHFDPSAAAKVHLLCRSMNLRGCRATFDDNILDFEL